MQRVTHCFRNLKMKEQIFIGDFLIMALVILIVLGVYFIQSTILLSFIQTSSKTITMMQEKKATEQASLRMKSYLNRKYQQGVLNVLHIDQFFEYFQENNDTSYHVSQELFPPCVKQAQQQIQLFSNLFCYQSFLSEDGITLPKNDKQIEFFNQTISILSQYSFLFPVIQTGLPQLSVLDLPNITFMASYPQLAYLADFHPQERPWFLYYLDASEKNPNKDYYYSPVYQSQATYQLSRTIISTIYDKNRNAIGFSRNNLQLVDPFIESMPFNTILTDENGEVLLSSMSSIKQIESLYIQNETQTGFNLSDWQLIQSYSKTNQSPSFCDEYESTFCLFNKFYNSSVQVSVQLFQIENFYLVVFANITAESKLQEELNNLTQNLHSLIGQKIWIQAVASSALIILTGFLIHLVFNPLFQLMDSLKLHIKSMGNNLNQEIFKMMNRKKKSKNVIYDLNLRFMTLKDQLNKSQTQKCHLCLEIESIEYNLKPPDIDYFQIPGKLCQIHNNPSQKREQLFYEQRSNHCISINTLDLVNKTLMKQYRNAHIID